MTSAATATITTSRRDALAMAACPERTLMADVARGDTRAFEELYRRHARNVNMQARKLCASRELAEEVAQDVFLSLWRSAHAYRPGASGVGLWLSSMVRNRAIDAWRRATIRPVEVEAIDDGPGQLRSAIGPDAWTPERAVVLSLIAGLPAGQKEAIFLAYFGGMSHAEIAAGTDVPLGTIKGRIRLGLEKLRYGLEGSGLEDQARGPRAVLRASPGGGGSGRGAIGVDRQQAQEVARETERTVEVNAPVGEAGDRLAPATRGGLRQATGERRDDQRRDVAQATAELEVVGAILAVDLVGDLDLVAA
jgi:RNA polymerase sigma-70 factor, ECF subfamily